MEIKEIWEPCSIQKKTKLKNRVYEESSIFKVVGFACKEKNITLEIVPEIKLSAVDGKLQKNTIEYKQTAGDRKRRKICKD